MSLPFHQRRSPRLAAHDYSTPGAYFVTVVTFERRCLLGDVVAGQSLPNAAGRMVIDVWHELGASHTCFDADTFVVMPNHVHGIVWLRTSSLPTGSVRLPALLRSFKSRTTCRYVEGVKRRGWPPFAQHLWQRSFYDRVIRDDKELAALRGYISTNPVRWTQDREFPESR